MERYERLCNLKAHTIDFQERVLDMLAQAGIWLPDADAIVCREEGTGERVTVIKNRVRVEAFVCQNELLSATVFEDIDGERIVVYRYDRYPEEKERPGEDL